LLFDLRAVVELPPAVRPLERVEYRHAWGHADLLPFDPWTGVECRHAWEHADLLPSNSNGGPLTTSSSTPDKVLAAFAALVGGGVERRELDRGGRTLRWIEAGSGAPTMVFEAGAMSPVIAFAAVFKALVPNHRVIAYDRAGYGASDPAPVDLELQLGDLAAVLEAAGPSVLVGHSWGGLLAQLINWERPELISGLVLLDPAHESLYLELDPETVAELGRHPTSPPSEDPRSTDILSYGPELVADISRSVNAASDLEQLLADACQSYLETDDQLFMHLEELPMILDHLEELSVRRSQGVWPKVPVVLLTATLGRPEEWIPKVIAVQDELATASNGQHVVVPDSGHHIHLDRPDLVIHWIQTIASRTP
jgi:pimeloyl-ACP methyl ester carboxylesterase